MKQEFTYGLCDAGTVFKPPKLSEISFALMFSSLLTVHARTCLDERVTILWLLPAALRIFL